MTDNKKCTGFWNGHESERIEEIDTEGRTVHYNRCKKCGERLTDGSEWAEKKEEVEFPIYVCTAPFGVLALDISGSISGHSSGFLTFNSGMFNGSIRSDIEEKYIVKYMDGQYLKTKTFDAEDTSLIVDGRFCLTCVKETHWNMENGEWKKTYSYVYDHTMSIHIPELPKLGSTTIEKIPLLTQSPFSIKEEQKP